MRRTINEEPGEQGSRRVEHANKKSYYISPRLIVYGDLARLTMNKLGNKADGAGHPSTKAGGS
jgi:hypothetical protein